MVGRRRVRACNPSCWGDAASGLRRGWLACCRMLAGVAGGGRVDPVLAGYERDMFDVRSELLWQFEALLDPAKHRRMCLHLPPRVTRALELIWG